MTRVTFDTYKVATLLQEKGFTKEQTEGLLAAVKEADVSQLATRQDLDLSNEKLKTEIFQFIITVAGAQTAAIAVIVAAIELLQ